MIPADVLAPPVFDTTAAVGTTKIFLAFAASMIDGRTVMEVDPDGRSAAEMTALWNYISDRLEKNFRRTVFAAPGTGAQAQANGVHRPSGGFGRRVAQ